ncbi:MAG: hypothetical protein PW792_15985 [Acidobacteriaceae bacterium]|nr:hypothetical protein [Acidobacteriaceae bacterium]
MRSFRPEEPLAFFDGIFVLNLPERSERLTATRAELQRLDPAAAARLQVAPGVRATEAHGFPSIGAYGCFLGHLNILRNARDRGLERILVLEDDVSFDPELWKQDWPAVQTALETAAWHIASLGFEDSVSTPDSSGGPLLPVVEPLMLAHCYAVHGRTLAAMISFLEEMMAREPGDPAGGPMHYDGALFHYTRDCAGVVRLRPRISLAGQRSSRSDIAGGRWFDRGVPWLRKAAERLRGVKNRLER